jgi:hypothetical protein
MAAPLRRRQRQEQHEENAVLQGLPEDVVLEHPRVVVEADHLEVRAQAGPVGERVVDRLDERPYDEDCVQRQGEYQEPHNEPVLAVLHGLPTPIFRRVPPLVTLAHWCL